MTGVDFSEKAIAFARETATDMEIDARFICSNVYDTLEHLDGERFDVVFTSYGAISWLPDLGPWAEMIAGALKPGGTFFVADHHPFLWMFEEEDKEPEFRFKYKYFGRESLRWEEKGSYAVPDSDFEGTSYSWQHTFEEIIESISTATLRVTSLREYPYLAFQWFPFMSKGDDGFWRLPEDMPDIPLMFSLTATRDA